MKLISKLFAVAVVAAVLSAPAVAEVRQNTPSATAPYIRETDPRAPGPGFITDARGGSGHPASALGYSLSTDTLGGTGGAGLAVATGGGGFSWHDAGVGAGAALAAVALLGGSLVLVRQRRQRLTAA